MKDINAPADERLYQEYLALSEQEKKNLVKKLKLSKASQVISYLYADNYP